MGDPECLSFIESYTDDMSAHIARMETPEERELGQKLSALAALETELAQRELDLATLRAELRAFEGRYLRIVGARYAELDEIKALIAEAQARLNPKNTATQQQASRARAQAEESGWATGSVKVLQQQHEFKPSDQLKSLYREIAKRVHPDLATDEENRTRRHELMAEANRAYEEGDEARLQRILREWECSPESVKGDGPGADLVRVIRKIAQVEERLRTIETEIAQLEESDLYKLWVEFWGAEPVRSLLEGDLLEEMASRLDQQIAEARSRLADIDIRRKS